MEKKVELNQAEAARKFFSNSDSVLNNKKKTVSSKSAVKSAANWLRKNREKYESQN